MAERVTKSVLPEQQRKIETRAAVVPIAGFIVIATVVAVLAVLGAAALFAQDQVQVQDKDKYSLRTGATQMMQAMRTGDQQHSMKVSEDALIGEMKGGRMKVIAGIVIAVAVIILIIVLVAR